MITGGWLGWRWVRWKISRLRSTNSITTPHGFVGPNSVHVGTCANVRAGRCTVHGVWLHRQYTLMVSEQQSRTREPVLITGGKAMPSANIRRALASATYLRLFPRQIG